MQSVLFLHIFNHCPLYGRITLIEIFSYLMAETKD
jgi:hypothetical protein